MSVECAGETYVTTNRQHFKPIKGAHYAKIAQKKKQTDESLISGHFKNNLQVNGIQLATKVWPKATVGIEEYKDYLKRLECCKKEIYKLYFQCPFVRIDLIEHMLRDLEKSTYQHVYSPNEFVSRKEARRFAKMALEPTNMKIYETTYGTYFNRIKELERFKDALYWRLSKDEKEELKNDLKRIYKLGVTTYHQDICVPIIELYKIREPGPPGPIDRYTLRKI